MRPRRGSGTHSDIVTPHPDDGSMNRRQFAAAGLIQMGGVDFDHVAVGVENVDLREPRRGMWL